MDRCDVHMAGTCIEKEKIQRSTEMSLKIYMELICTLP